MSKLQRIVSASVLGFAAIAALPGVQAARGPAQISEAQAAQIDAAVQVDPKHGAIAQAVEEAKPTIVAFLKIHSCMAGYNASALNVFAAPGKVYPDNNYIHAPMPKMARHDKSACITVQRLQGWSMPAPDTLRFEVVYVSDSSGESGKSFHELRKQASGEWLFSR